MSEQTRGKYRVIEYLDPRTGYREVRTLEFDEAGGVMAGLVDDGVWWWEDGDSRRYRFVPYHRVLMVHDETEDSYDASMGQYPYTPIRARP